MTEQDITMTEDNEEKMALYFQNEEGEPYLDENGEQQCVVISLESFRNLEYIAEKENISISDAFINLIRKSSFYKE